MKNKGSLQSKHGTWYIVVSFKDEFDKPKTKWINTNLRVENNKTKAKQLMKSILKNYEIEKDIKPKEAEGSVHHFALREAGLSEGRPQDRLPMLRHRRRLHRRIRS